MQGDVRIDIAVQVVVVQAVDHAVAADRDRAERAEQAPEEFIQRARFEQAVMRCLVREDK